MRNCYPKVFNKNQDKELQKWILRAMVVNYLVDGSVSFFNRTKAYDYKFQELFDMVKRLEKVLGEVPADQTVCS